ncbi:MAG: ADP-glyceromanno-heptose 6-epimerase [Pseudomonadota bacterium]|nr:ADP-glyceromanno-heptose 6-epimerase [Pseudomonadota bacterium]
MKLVTGAAGFIGSNLVAALEQSGDSVVICDWLDDQSKIRNIDKLGTLTRVPPNDLFSFLAEHSKDIETIFHLGAISSTTESNEDLILKTNVELPIRIWNWCCDNNSRLIYASSAATYGNGNLGFFDNDSVDYLKNLKPLNVYGRSKNQFDIWVAEEIKRGSRTPAQWAGVKFFNVYGPNEYHKGYQMSVVPQIYNQIIENGEARLFKSYNSQFKDGEQQRDFVWVGDCVSFMRWLDQSSEISGIFNCGSGTARTFFDVADIIFKAMKREARVRYISMPNNVKQHYQYFTRANMEKPFAAGYTTELTTLESGVTQYVQEYLMTNEKYI